MRRFIAGATAVALLAVGLGGCSTKMQSGASIGAGIGVATGAVVGAVLGGGRGAAIGAGAGVLIGGLVGAGVGKHFDDKEERSRAQAAKIVAYRPEQGHVIVVSDTSVTPVPANVGDDVRVKVSYELLTPNAEQMVPITERWLVVHEGKPVGTAIVRPVQQKAQGGHSSTFKFTVNDDFLPGEYEVITTISNGATERQATSKVRVGNI
jgi:hypothetical protein